jgi:serine/threonine protein kinase
MPENRHDDDKTHVPAPLVKDTMVGRYQIIDKIGAGGMGEVYLADDTELDRKVALKFLPTRLCPDEDSRARFKREARAAARLSHPGIVTIYEVDEFQSQPFYSMAYVEGQTLSQFSSKGILDIDTVIDLGIQISLALIAAHEQGITHRDLKPDNVIIDSKNKIHVLDFGLAMISTSAPGKKPEDTVTRLESLGTVAGTLPYMAPEQLRGEKSSPLMDIYALGVILYELSTGERPFTGASNADLTTSILRDVAQPAMEKRRNIPYDLDRIISRCLHKNPERRFQSVKDIRNELVDLADLLAQGDVRYDIDSVGVASRLSLIEAEFTLTADLVRQLDFKTPQMIGDCFTYLDNGIKSDIVTIFLHGLGMDQRQFAELLSIFPYRGIAPSLFGFGAHSSQRLPLSLNDHSILLRAFFRAIRTQFQPRHIILCGHSTGADHLLHLISSEEGVGVNISGLISFGCNASLENCVLSSKLATLTSGNESDLIDAIMEFGRNVDSLKDYLTICEYIVKGFQKFETNIDALGHFAVGIVKPFEKHGWEQFPLWYRAAVRHVRLIRFVFSLYELDTLDRILREHLENNVLGDDFKESTIVREDVSHLDLSNPELMLNHLRAVINQIES